jgi:hypothetical protein
VIAEAATAAHASQTPGLFLLVWGLGATAAGLLTVTNFRGFADNFARRAEAASPRRRRRPTWTLTPPQDPAAKTRQIRLIAIPFAIVGPIVTVIGIISVSHGRIAVSGWGAPPLPFRIAFIAFAAAAVGWSWLSRDGFFRPAARRGGSRLAAAVISSLGSLTFGIGLAMGQPTVAIVALIFVGLPSLILMTGDKTAGPGSS